VASIWLLAVNPEQESCRVGAWGFADRLLKRLQNAFKKGKFGALGGAFLRVTLPQGVGHCLALGILSPCGSYKYSLPKGGTTPLRGPAVPNNSLKPAGGWGSTQLEIKKGVGGFGGLAPPPALRFVVDPLTLRTVTAGATVRSRGVPFHCNGGIVTTCYL
jgi:hypothetical protein